MSAALPAMLGTAQVTDASGARLDFARGRWLDLDGGIIAAPPSIHGAVLAAVQSVRASKL
jgi:hypothetical protein